MHIKQNNKMPAMYN